jgi:hypothetical protein
MQSRACVISYHHTESGLCYLITTRERHAESDLCDCITAWVGVYTQLYTPTANLHPVIYTNNKRLSEVVYPYRVIHVHLSIHNTSESDMCVILEDLGLVPPPMYNKLTANLQPYTYGHV